MSQPINWADYHRWLERLHTGYACSMSCPSLGDVCSRLLALVLTGAFSVGS
ncbi:hypothetical protein [Mesorhizobium sp. B2-4-9]|uniref:hypothetical protein n=1 Tax=Mesorhizobium sp. B2-4-9 TaxID=2589940 RepID=UPI0015E4340C|nr:hypothetical protein [Mesorhizobium sp. B2-4-9]